MKTFIVSIITICSFLFLTACTSPDSDNAMRERDQIRNELNPNQHTQTPENQDMNHQLGFVKYSKTEVEDDRQSIKEAKIDRNEMADMITRIILTNDGFNEVATLVTDQEVLIAYEKNDDAKNADEIAKDTAESIMPGFYDVHVSDNETLMNDIQSLHNSTTNREYDNLINQIIDEMKES